MAIRKKRSPNNILNAEQRLEVLRLYRESDLSVRQIAADFQVSSKQIRNLVAATANQIGALQRQKKKASVGGRLPDSEAAAMWRKRCTDTELRLSETMLELRQAQQELELERLRTAQAWNVSARHYRKGRRVMVGASVDEIDGEVRIVAHMLGDDEETRRSLPLINGQYIAEMIREWLFCDTRAPKVVGQ